MFENYDGMPPIPASFRDEYDGYDVDLTMGEITVSPEKRAVGVASVSWASCIE